MIGWNNSETTQRSQISKTLREVIKVSPQKPLKKKFSVDSFVLIWFDFVDREP